MTAENRNGPNNVFVIKDNIRGHQNQSSGIAFWLASLAGSKVIDISIPKLSPLRRFMYLKILARRLKSGESEACRWWLQRTLGSSILRDMLQDAHKPGVKSNDMLFISAGSSGAPFCLAFARVTGARSCCIMTPSVLGTGPFDFAIVPEHDFPTSSPNLLVTLGAPNMISQELLEAEGELLASRYPSEAAEKWGILTGGDDANYTIPPEWVEGILKPLLQTASENGVDIFITTSRRTLSATEERITEVVDDFPNVRMLILGTKENWNPVPGMLAVCNRIFCTEDSVSMISEAATAGYLVQILRVGRKGGARKTFQDLTAKIACRNLLAPKRLWGVPRFDLMIESFCSKGFAEVYDPARSSGTVSIPEERGGNTSLNEARRAAEWIIQGWNT